MLEMKIFKFTLIVSILLSGSISCETDTIQISGDLQKMEATKYFDAEVFAEPYLKVYGTWKLFEVSGGFAGNGHDLNFEYLEIKEYGIYGFLSNDTLLEYGKISPAVQTTNDLRLKVDFEADEESDLFFSDSEKYVEFSGSDTLHLNSPCCDRYNYHLKRVK